MSCERVSWIWSTWVKSSHLENSELLVASACLPVVNPELFERLSAGRVVLFACPERESGAYYGKLASMIRSSRPRRILVVTVDGSPHCFALQASVNEAEYILGVKIEKEHYVVVDGKELKKISPNAMRIARYLSIVNDIIEKNPEVLNELAKHSKEYALARSLETHSDKSVSGSLTGKE